MGGGAAAADAADAADETDAGGGKAGGGEGAVDAGMKALRMMKNMKTYEEPRRGQPVSEDTRFMIANMFIKIFPTLQGDWCEFDGTFEDWFVSILARTQGRAMTHTRFSYAMLDRLWRSHARDARRAFWNKKAFSEQDTIEKMKSEKGIRELAGKLTSFAPFLPGSFKQKSQDVFDLEAMIEQMSDRNAAMALFVTHTCPCELHEGMIRFLHAHERKKHQNRRRSEEELERELQDPTLWRAACEKNPYLCALYAEVRLTVSLDFMIMLLRQRLGLAEDERIDYWVSHEWGKEAAMRHDHICFFIPGTPDLSWSDEDLLADVQGLLTGVPNLSDVNLHRLHDFHKDIIVECNELKEPPETVTDEQFRQVSEKRRWSARAAWGRGLDFVSAG